MVDESNSILRDEEISASPEAGIESDGSIEPDGKDPGPVAERSRDIFDAMAAIDPRGATALREEWGNEFEMNVNFARSAAEAFADPELIAMLEETGLGNDPRFLRVAAKIGRLLSGSDTTSDRGQSDQGREGLESTLETLSKRPDYWSDRVQQQVRQIHVALHGNGPIAVHRAVGDAGEVSGRNAHSAR